MRKSLFSLAAAGLLVSGASAQVIVDSTGATAGSVTTIAAGIAAATPGQTVTVVNAGSPYVEPIVIEKAITLSGEDPADPPVITGTPTSGTAFGGGDAMFILADGDVTVENLIINPGTVTGDIMRGSATTGNTLNLTLRNLHLAPDTVPFNADDFIDVATAGGTQWPDDGIYFVNTAGLGNAGDMNLVMDGVRVFGVAGDDAVVAYSGTNGSTSMTDCVVNGVADDGIQIGTVLDAAPASQVGTFEITGTRTDPGLILFNTGDGASIFETADVTIDHFVGVNNTGGLTGAAMFITSPDVINISVSDSLFLGNDVGFGLLGTPDQPSVTSFTNVTFIDNPVGINIADTQDTNQTLSVTNAVFSGTGTGIDNTAGGTLNINLDSIAFATTLGAGLDDSTATVTQANVLTINPGLINTLIPPYTDETADVSNPALEAAGTGGIDIDGFGILQIPTTPASADQLWMHY